MSDHVLNFVRCQWCGGNAGAPDHQCTPEGLAKADSAAAEAVKAMGFGAGHKPTRKQRSKWVESSPGPVASLIGSDYGVRVWQRNVHDGHLTAVVAEEPLGWHLSISHRTNTVPPKPGRYPTWDEIAHARYELLPHALDFVMHLPPPDEYVAVHDTTFHLHEHPERAAGATEAGGDE